MSSPITLSGFNNIDFNVVLEAMMQQERVPVTQLETQKKSLEGQNTAFGTLATKLAALDSAVADLTRADAFAGSKVTVSDTATLSATGGTSTPEGTYSITVEALARAQVTVSSTTFADRDTTTVANGGSLVFGNGQQLTLTGPVTLQGLADAINARSAELGATASIVRGTDARYQLVLTGTKTGASNGFSIEGTLNKGKTIVTTGLTNGGASALAFTVAPVQVATDARAVVNGVTATSETNTFDGVIAGVSFTALKEVPGTPVTLTITASLDSVRNLIQKLVTAFNEVVKYLDGQGTAAAKGDTNSIGRDALARSLRRTISSSLAQNFGGGSLNNLALAGFEFERDGTMSFDASAFEKAASTNRPALLTLFRGTDGTGGAFGTLAGVIEQYTRAGGLLPTAQNRIGAQVTAIASRIEALEARLEIRRQALQREFIAADQTISQLNASKGQLSSLSGSLF